MELETVKMNIEMAKDYLFKRAIERVGEDKIMPVGERDSFAEGYMFCHETRILAFYFENGDKSSKCVAVKIDPSFL
jgi:hypothetical protein